MEIFTEYYYSKLEIFTSRQIVDDLFVDLTPVKRHSYSEDTVYYTTTKLRSNKVGAGLCLSIRKNFVILKETKKKKKIE